MFGSVWEWTSDYYVNGYERQALSGAVERVLRGGSWTDPAEVVTVSFRMSRRGDIARGMACDHLAPNIGFRLCRMERHTHWGGAS